MGFSRIKNSAMALLAGIVALAAAAPAARADHRYLVDLAYRMENAAARVYNAAVYDRGDDSYSGRQAIADLRRLVDDARDFRYELERYSDSYARDEFYDLRSSVEQADRSVRSANFGYSVRDAMIDAIDVFYTLEREFWNDNREPPYRPYPPRDPYPPHDPYPPRPYPPAPRPYPPAPPPRHDPRPTPPRHDPRPTPPRHDPRPTPPRHDPRPTPPRHDPRPTPPRNDPRPPAPRPAPYPGNPGGGHGGHR
ncbi:MAG: hypothetical protein NDJ90_15695 [Oligoflexia bacterium]|nr:hypothetical protein [Oligoflexia bacterium]